MKITSHRSACPSDGDKTDIYGALLDRSGTDKFWNRLDMHQKHYYHTIMTKNVTVVDEPAGTGKTSVAFLPALELLREGKIAKIVYLRTPDVRSLKLGYLKGSQEDKESIYAGPLYDAMASCGYQPDIVDAFMTTGMLEARTDIDLRGITFRKSFILFDEAQNADLETLKLVVTRVADDSKLVLCGHSGQCDDPKMTRYGTDRLLPFQVMRIHLLKKMWSGQASLVTNYRGAISRWADKVNETIEELA